MTAHQFSMEHYNQHGATLMSCENLKQPMQSFIATALTKAADYFETRKQRRIDRQAFDRMLGLEDEMLRDIGVTRDDVKWASTLPVATNASRALEQAKRFGHH